MGKGAIAVIGSLNIDFITRTARVPAGGETLRANSFETGFGGKGANQAVACARLSRHKDGSTASNLDIKVSMVGAVGTDSFGRDFLEALKKDGIDTTHIEQIDGAKTGNANIIVEEESGENRILFFPGANYASGESTKHLVPEEADVVVFQLEIPLVQVAHNIKLASQQGKYVIVNPAPAQTLPNDLYQYIDCLIVNESEADILREAAKPMEYDDAPEICGQFLTRGVRDMVIVTLGSKGACYGTKQDNDSTDTAYIAAQKVKVIDTTAAGDTFVGAIAVKVASNGGKFPSDRKNVLAFANAAGARTVEKPGAQSAIPWLNEVIDG